MPLFRLSSLLRTPLAVLALVAAALVAAPVTPVAAQSKGTLPQPYVSRSLDLVLLPVTDAVRREFKLGKKAAGAVVASVEPGGTGEFFGIEPGDVISQVDGRAIRRPVDIDSMVRYGLKKDESFFRLDGTRKNKRLRTWVVLSQDDYEKPVALDKIKAWRGYGGRGQRRGAGYFYYPDYCDVYYDDFFTVWDYSYTYIEDIIVTEVYITSYESTETVFYYDEAAIGYDWPGDDYITEVDSYVYSEEFTAEYNSTEVVYETETSGADDTDDALGVSAEGYDDTATEEPAADEAVTQEPAYEPAASDEPAYEEAVADEPASEETAYEEPAYEEAVAEEPAYEEPAYEEPAYEEPAYEEPAYDGGGSSCYYDDEGNEVCG